MVSAAAFTYKTKHEAEDRLAHVRKIEAEIKYEQDTTDLLKADWSMLTPSRLQKLSEIYQAELQLAPVEASQIGGIKDLPLKPVGIPDLSTERLGGMADNAKDHIVTGTVVQ